MSLVLPDNYNADGLAPRILIYDKNLRLQYEYTHPQLIADGTQDFTLLDWNISGGINSNTGSASVIIEDHDNSLTESGDLIIRPGWHIQIFLGKDAQNLESWFFGIVNAPRLIRQGYNQQTVSVSAYGYAHTLSTRFVSLDHTQERDENNQLDNSDMSACVSELVKQVFDSTSLLLPPPDPNLTLDGVDQIDIKLANLKKNNQSQGIVISELANIANCVYGIDPDLDFFFHSANRHSGYTVTNGDATQIDPDKLMIIRNRPFSYTDTVVRKAFTSLIGIDLTLQLDKVADEGGTSTMDIDADYYNYLGFEINFLGDINELELLFKRVGNITRDLDWQVRSYTSGTDSTPSPNDGTQEASGTLTDDRLNEMTENENTWLSFNLSGSANPNITRRMIWFGTISGQFSNFQILYKAGTPTAIFGSSGYSVNDQNLPDGIPRMRVLDVARQTLLKAQNLKVQREQSHKEQMQYMSGTPNSETAEAIVTGLLDQAGQERRVYSMTVSTPNTRPPLGQQIKILDTFNNLNKDALLIGYDISASRADKLTAIDMTLECERYI